MSYECLLACFLAPAIVAFPCRFIGAAIGEKIGKVGRHAIAWFSMFASAALTSLTIHYLRDSSAFPANINKGISEPVLVSAIVVATALEFLLCTLWLTFVWKVDKPTSTTHVEAVAEFREDGNPYAPPPST